MIMPDAHKYQVPAPALPAAAPVASVEVPGYCDMAALVAAAGGGSSWYRGGRLYVAGVAQAQLDAALTSHDFAADRERTKLEAVRAARRDAYPVVGDQLDAIMRGLRAYRDGQPLPAETVEWINQCEAVKASHPKEG